MNYGIFVNGNQLGHKGSDSLKQDASTREQSNETDKAYVEESWESSNYGNPLYIVHYPGGVSFSTMCQWIAQREVDLFNAKL